MKKPLLINITGPTASGKTAMAIALARRLNTEILSADSRQIYQEMRIGTARPSEEELRAVPHHFIAEKSVFDPYTAADFEREAMERLTKLFQKYPVVIMAGGTGLWFKAVNDGLDDIPAVPENIRRRVVRLWQREGLKALQKEVALRDPDYYREADIKNPRRLMRALEIILHTGKPFSAFRTGQPKSRPFDALWIGLDMPKDLLNRRIARRTDGMMEQGLLAEAEALYPHRHLNALQTVGYKELFDYLDGKIDLNEARRQIIIHTRQYAKRQRTWFRKNPRIQWFDMQNPEKTQEEIYRYVNQYLHRR